MRSRSIIITIVATLLLFPVSSNAVYAKGQGSLMILRDGEGVHSNIGAITLLGGVV